MLAYCGTNTSQSETEKKYAEGVRGEITEQLTEGEYLAEELKKFDKIVVPHGFYLVFAGNKNDKNKFRIFENEECVIDGRIDEYNEVLLFNLGKEGIRIDFGIKEELSDEDLASVTGAKGCGTRIIHGEKENTGLTCGVRITI